MILISIDNNLDTGTVSIGYLSCGCWLLQIESTLLFLPVLWIDIFWYGSGSADPDH
jgi:hypothetical protein